MTKEEYNDRLAEIGTALASMFDTLAKATVERRELSAQETVEIMTSVTMLTHVVTVSLTELAHHAGRIADQGDRDFSAAVAAQAEDVAQELHKERTTRNFIGKKNN